jgi:hypothetical protein
VVRHRLVRDIIRAFDHYHATQNGGAEDGVGDALDPQAQADASSPAEPAEPDAPPAGPETAPSV